MRVITCTRRIQFCAGHRVYKHESKCAHIHGHNYSAFITAQAEQLDSIGRVVDFSVLKEKYGGWIELNWDHGFIFWQEDKEMHRLFTSQDGSPAVLGQHKHFMLPQNPTAENLAGHLLGLGGILLAGTGVTIKSVELFETENCSAKVWRE